MKNFQRFIDEFGIELDSTGNISTAGFMKLITISTKRLDELAAALSAQRDVNITLREENKKLHNLISEYNKTFLKFYPELLVSRAIAESLIN